METREEITSAELKDHHPIFLKFAPAWKRVLAYIIDIVVLEVIVSIMFTVTFYRDLSQIITQNDFNLQYKLILAFWNNHSFQKLIVDYILQAAYFSLQWTGSSRTLGARLLKIAVITMDKKKLTLIQGIVRYSILSLSSVAFYIPQIFVINSTYHQRIHDILTNTVVVEVPEMPDKNEPEHDSGETVNDKTNDENV